MKMNKLKTFDVSRVTSYKIFEKLTMHYRDYAVCYDVAFFILYFLLGKYSVVSVTAWLVIP